MKPRYRHFSRKVRSLLIRFEQWTPAIPLCIIVYIGFAH